MNLSAPLIYFYFYLLQKLYQQSLKKLDTFLENEFFAILGVSVDDLGSRYEKN